MTHQKACKFCGKQLTVESDNECPPEWVASLLPMLACNRCADYRARMAKLSDGIRFACLNYIQLVNCNKLTDEDTAKTRVTLTTLTKCVADVVCRFYSRVTAWEPDFVQQLLDYPDKHAKVLATYISLVRKAN